VAREEIFVSMDIEADGRAPGLSNLLSFGAAAFTIGKSMLGTFTRNLTTLPDAAPEPDTMAWWARNREAWNAARLNPVDPAVAMPDFVRWVDGLSERGNPVFVGYPAAYDFKWVDYWCVRFAGRNPFGFSGCIDIKTLAWAHLGGSFPSVSKRNFPKRWFDPSPHTHVALDDAIEQGAMFINLLREIRGLPTLGPAVYPPGGSGGGAGEEPR